MSRRTPSKGPRRQWDEWLLSECAPFIRRILARRATDADRTKVAREFADWLEARGDHDHAKWFRHPKLTWQVTHYGSVCWNVDPWDNRPHGGCGARIDNHWWTIRFPTRAYIESYAAEKLLRAWIQNRVEFEEYSWTREVARRLGLIGEYDKQVRERADRKERCRLEEIAKEIQDRKTYKELRLKFNTGRFEYGAGI